MASSRTRQMDEVTKLNEEMWDSRAETYDRCLAFLRWTQKKLISVLQLGGNPHLLDLGCGTGWAVRYAASLTNGHGEFYGIDISSRMIERAEASSTNYRNVHFRRGNAEELPFENGVFDRIICSNAFHHYSDPDKVAREAYRVLKPHGRIYILDVTADGFTRILDRLAKKVERGHVKIYSTREYRSLFERAGLLFVNSRSILPSLKIHIAEKVV
jgi:ubiquinone/menaquinone biosynthesis C-methylase UbiE